MKKLVFAAILAATTQAHAATTKVYLNGQASGGVEKTEALKAALLNNAKVWECQDQELVLHKATLRGDGDKTYHLTQPSGSDLGKGGALKASLKGEKVQLCRMMVADQRKGTLRAF